MKNKNLHNAKAKELDQFYTNPLVSDELVSIVSKMLPEEITKNIVEPSAGTGSFIESLNKIGVNDSKIKGYDLEPKGRKNIYKKNYLTFKRNHSKKRFIIGNPPFGKRGKLALEFLNKCLCESNYVAMILPNIFNRYSMHKKVNSNARLIYSKSLKENSFILNGREYDVKCVFQIWTTVITFAKDLRIKAPPQIRHNDFTTWIHNNTKNTLKYFDKEKYGWDIAVHRQGYYDYSKIITNPKELISNRQYFFIKYNNDEAIKIIKKIDFRKLSLTNTQVHGFSTSDFVKEYKNLKGEKW